MISVKLATLRIWLAALTPGRSFVWLLPVVYLSTGCTVDLNERIVPCPKGNIVESAHSWGGTIALRPAPSQDWPNVLREPIRQYGLPPINQLELERRHGVPARSWSVEGRPFITYFRPGGRLQLGLEEERSGSAVARSWRLRFVPQKTSIAEVFEDHATSCIDPLMRPDVDVLVLSRASGVPKVSVKVRGGEPQEIVWLNLHQP